MSIHVRLLFALILKHRHVAELEEIFSVQLVYMRLDARLRLDAAANIIVKHAIGKAEIILVGLTAKPVGRGFVVILFGQTEVCRNKLDFFNGEA